MRGFLIAESSFFCSGGSPQQAAALGFRQPSPGKFLTPRFGGAKFPVDAFGIDPLVFMLKSRLACGAF